MKYLKVLAIYIRNSILREMQHRVHFTASVIGDILNMLVKYMLPIFIIGSIGELRGGWTRERIILYMSIYMLVIGIDRTFIPHSTHLPEHIIQGTLDKYIMLPIDEQFPAFFGFFNWDHIPNIIAGIIGILYALSVLSFEISILSVLLLSIVLISGTLVFLSIHSIIMTLSFHLKGTDNMGSLLHVVDVASNMPTDVLPRITRDIFTYFIPLVFVATLPAKAILEISFEKTLCSILAALVTTSVARIFWKISIRKYNGASS